MTDLTVPDAMGNDFLKAKVENVLAKIVEAKETIMDDALRSTKWEVKYRIEQGLHKNKTIRAWYFATLNITKADGSIKKGGIWKLRLLALACGVHDEYKLKAFGSNMLMNKQLYISTQLSARDNRYFEVINERSIEEYQEEILDMEKNEIENVGKTEKPPAESSPVSKDDLPF